MQSYSPTKSKMLTNTFFTFLLLALSTIASAQTESEGGGVYLKNGGKLMNSIVTQNYAIKGFGVSGTSGEVLNSNINNNLYLNKEIVVPGDILMNDGTVYTPQYVNGTLVFPTGYTVANVIGVCFWTNESNDFVNAKSWVVAITENTGIPWTPTISYQQVIIPDLVNYETPAPAILDKEGFTNTAKIVGYTGFTGVSSLTISNCAAKYCYQYGTAAGVWFLPALNQLVELYRTLTIVNYVLTKLNALQSSIVPISITENYWSSSQVNNQEAWALKLTNETPTSRLNKSNNNRTRAIRVINKTK
jgi:hypothetical protein